jgi:hypothetical protein
MEIFAINSDILKAICFFTLFNMFYTLVVTVWYGRGKRNNAPNYNKSIEHLKELSRIDSERLDVANDRIENLNQRMDILRKSSDERAEFISDALTEATNMLKDGVQTFQIGNDGVSISNDKNFNFYYLNKNKVKFGNNKILNNMLKHFRKKNKYSHIKTKDNIIEFLPNETFKFEFNKAYKRLNSAKQYLKTKNKI